MERTEEQLKQAGLDGALHILATPSGRPVDEMRAAAMRVNQAIEDEKAEYAALRAQYDHDSLDLLSAGNLAGAKELADRVTAKRQKVEQFETSIKEMNRRQLAAKRDAEMAEARAKQARAKPLMDKREALAVKLEALVQEAGECWAEVEALGFKIMHELPTDRPAMMDFLDRGDIERRVENALRVASGRGIEGPSGIAGPCRRGHSELISLHMPKSEAFEVRLLADGTLVREPPRARKAA